MNPRILDKRKIHHSNHLPYCSHLGYRLRLNYRHHVELDLRHHAVFIYPPNQWTIFCLAVSYLVHLLDSSSDLSRSAMLLELLRNGSGSFIGNSVFQPNC